MTAPVENYSVSEIKDALNKGIEYVAKKKGKEVRACDYISKDKVPQRIIDAFSNKKNIETVSPLDAPLKDVHAVKPTKYICHIFNMSINKLIKKRRIQYV